MNEYNVNILKNIRDNIPLREEDDHLHSALLKLSNTGYIIWTVNGYKLSDMGFMFLKYGPCLNETLNNIKMKDANIKLEGYWYSSSEPHYSMPIHSDMVYPLKGKILEALNNAEKKAHVRSFKGWSICRCCQKHNGTDDFTLNGWRWPSGLKHYIEIHNIIPNHAFLEEALGMEL